MVMLPLPMCPVAGQAELMHHTVCGFMSVSCWFRHPGLSMNPSILLRGEAQTTVTYSLTGSTRWLEIRCSAPRPVINHRATKGRTVNGAHLSPETYVWM